MFRVRLAPIFMALAVMITIAASGAQAAIEEKRVALVIGNSDYQHTTRLNNPVRDAKAVAAALGRLGFDVVEGFDLDQAQMRGKIREFTSRIDSASVSLFYYAGHGFQIDGKNHLAPIDARLSREADVDFETVPLNLVLRQMEREKRTNLIFLDACRDNPLATKLARSMGRARSAAVARGLARIESGVGTLIGYATSPGMVAYDGEGDHSPYTSAILKHIEKPGVSINDMMIAVRQDVLAESKGKQIPWEHSSLTGQYYFKDAVEVAAAQTTPEPETTANAEAANQAVASAYRATVAVGSCGAYKIFEEQHRSSFYGRLAEEYLKTNCETSKRAIQVEPSKAAATADKTKKIVVATAEPAPSAEEPAKAVGRKPDIGALTVSIQQQLARVGCNPGRPDGDWGKRTRDAMSRFNQQASFDLPTDKPSEAALTALKAKTGKVCKAAPVKAVTPPAKSPKKKVAAPSHPPATAQRKVGPPPGRKKKPEYWGGEDTRADCVAKLIWTADCFPKKRR